MNRLLRIVLLLVALWVLAPLTVGPALADPIGGVIVTPGTGNNLGQCDCGPSRVTRRRRMLITDYPTAHGFDLRIGLIMRDYATKNRTTLTSRYDIIVCRIDDSTCKLWRVHRCAAISHSTTYEAVGASKLVGPPPAAGAGARWVHVRSECRIAAYR